MHMTLGKIAAGLGVLFIVGSICKVVLDGRREEKAAQLAAAAQDAQGDTLNDGNSVAGMKLLIIAAHAQSKYQYETLNGKVRNIGTTPIPDGEVTVLEVDKDGNTIGQVPGVLDVNPLAPGGTSTFTVMFPQPDNIAKWGLGFTSNGGPQIPVIQDPNSSIEL